MKYQIISNGWPKTGLLRYESEHPRPGGPVKQYFFFIPRAVFLSSFITYWVFFPFMKIFCHSHHFLSDHITCRSNYNNEQKFYQEAQNSFHNAFDWQKVYRTASRWIEPESWININSIFSELWGFGRYTFQIQSFVETWRNPGLCFSGIWVQNLGQFPGSCKDGDVNSS